MSATTMNAIQEKLEQAAELLDSRFLEREELNRLLLLGLMSGENVLLVGPPGTAKSQLARAVSQLFGGARWYEYLLTRFTTPDELFGPVSLQQLKQDRYVRQTAGYLPEAEFAFLDEIFKAGSAILNALLSILNERVFFNGQDRQEVPLLFLIAASNELPEEGEQLDALYDRFLIRYEVSYLDRMSSYERMFQLPDDPLPAVLTLRDVQAVREAARGVRIPEPLIYLLFGLKTAMEEKDYRISDRRWRRIGQVWKTSAALNGRDTVTVWDTVYTPHMLWDYPEDLPALTEIFEEAFRNGLRAESERELPLKRYEGVAAHWKGRVDALNAFHFRKEVGGKLSSEDRQRAQADLDTSRAELEETARELRGKLVQWLQREKDIAGYLRNRNFLLLQTERYAMHVAGLRLQGERTLQSLQSVYRSLFDRDIPGLQYDFTK